MVPAAPRVWVALLHSQQGHTLQFCRKKRCPDFFTSQRDLDVLRKSTWKLSNKSQLQIGLWEALGLCL